ncbi:MAG: ATP-binding cassette protein, partial [Nevskia sp.]|nr:ATP-binding cassette protein [Nevskia sp.]
MRARAPCKSPTHMLLSLKNLSLAMGTTVLLDQVNITLDRGERLCLVGRNGAGKSTLMKLIAGQQKADSGEIVRTQGMRVAQLSQDVPKGIEGTVFDVVAAGLGEVGRLLAQYHHLLAHEPDNMNALGRVQTA